jgi:hypothetical protein
VPIYEVVAHCIQEAAESELLRTGTEHCGCLTKKDQLSAVVLLLLRSTSLFDSMIELLAMRRLDGYDAVRRAYLETWLLPFQFRFHFNSASRTPIFIGQHTSFSSLIVAGHHSEGPL